MPNNFKNLSCEMIQDISVLHVPVSVLSETATFATDNLTPHITTVITLFWAAISGIV